MGFFNNLFGNTDSADDFCAICNAKLPSALIPFNGTEKLMDGRICKDCKEQVSPFVTGYKKISVNDMAAHLQYRRENQEYIRGFMETDRFETPNMVIAIDGNTQQILFCRHHDYRNYNPDLLLCSQITGVQYRIAEIASPSNRDFGDGMGPRRIMEYSYEFQFTVYVNSPWFSDIHFDAQRNVRANLMNPEEIAQAYDTGKALYEFFESLGVPCTYFDQTTFGAENIRSGMAAERVMMENGMGPQPPVPAPETPAPTPDPLPTPDPNPTPGYDPIAMGAAAGMGMEMQRKNPRNMEHPAASPAHHMDTGRPGMDMRQPHTNNRQPERNMQQSRMDSRQPERNMQQSRMDNRQPERNMQQSRMDSRQSGMSMNQQQVPDSRRQNNNYRQDVQSGMSRQPQMNAGSRPTGNNAGRPTGTNIARPAGNNGRPAGNNAGPAGNNSRPAANNTRPAANSTGRPASGTSSSSRTNNERSTNTSMKGRGRK